MKSMAAIALALLFVACASNSGMYSSADNGGVAVSLDQVAGGSDMFYFRGAVNVQYRLTIENPTNDTITLRRIRLDTVGRGAYALRTGSTPISATVAPRSTVTIPLSAWGQSAGGFIRSTEPVTLRGVAMFDSPHGSFQSVFNEILPQ
jgi:hypothetical protein